MRLKYIKRIYKTVHYLLLVYIAFHKMWAIVPLRMICKMIEIPPHFHLHLKVSVFLVHSLGGGCVGSSTCWNSYLFDLVSIVRNVCATGTAGCYRRLCICFLSSHNVSYSYAHKSGTGLWRSCSKSMCSVAEDKRDLSVGVRLLPSLHWLRQDWSPWHICMCVLSLVLYVVRFGLGIWEQ